MMLMLMMMIIFIVLVGQLVEQHKKHLLGFDERAEDERAIEILTAEITRVHSSLSLSLS